MQLRTQTLVFRRTHRRNSKRYTKEARALAGEGWGFRDEEMRKAMRPLMMCSHISDGAFCKKKRICHSTAYVFLCGFSYL